MAATALLGSSRPTASHHGALGRIASRTFGIVRFLARTIAVLLVATAIAAPIAPAALLALGHEPTFLGDEVMGQEVTLATASAFACVVLALALGVVWGGTTIRSRRADARYW